MTCFLLLFACVTLLSDNLDQRYRRCLSCSIVSLSGGDWIAALKYLLLFALVAAQYAQFRK